jgi:hypothetical protein
LLLLLLLLLLLPLGADTSWALALVKTRAYGDADQLMLMPLHDLINHRERGQANLLHHTAGAAAGAAAAADSAQSLTGRGR